MAAILALPAQCYFSDLIKLYVCFQPSTKKKCSKLNTNNLTSMDLDTFHSESAQDVFSPAAGCMGISDQQGAKLR